MSEIEMKIHEKTEKIDEMCSKLIDCLDTQMGQGIENIDCMEFGEVIDMVKDLAESKEKMIKAMYDEEMLKSMVKTTPGH